MTLGDGIFYSSLVLGTIALFIATKDRWNWKKIILWPLTVVVVVVFIWGTAAFVQSRIPYKPKVQESFWGVSLLSSKADVKFMKGMPTTQDEGVWKYKEEKTYTNDSSYNIVFHDDKVGVVYFEGDNWLYAPELQGIELGNSEKEVRKRFGEPSKISVADDELGRLYAYKDFNVFFFLMEGEVKLYGIYNPALGTPKFGTTKTSN